MTTPRFAPGTFTPAPGPGRPFAMLVAQAGIELRLALRGGEQVLLTLLIPTALVVVSFVLGFLVCSRRAPRLSEEL